MHPPCIRHSLSYLPTLAGFASLDLASPAVHMAPNFSFSWAPNEDSQTLCSERYLLQGVIISAIAYGVTVSLYFLSFYHLIHEQNRVESKNRLPLLIFITIYIILGTIFMIGLVIFTQMSFIDDRNYPGGPSAFETDTISIPIKSAANVASILSGLLSDALVVWRFKVIYQMCSVPLWIVMLFPCLLLAVSAAMGIMFIIQVSITNPFVSNGINYTMPYLSISLALNIILTIAIVLRLLSWRYHIVSLMGPEYGTQYTSATAMIIESAALYSAISIAFLVLFGLGKPVSQVISQPLIQFQTIATLLIVFRVAQGKGWTEDTATYVMSESDPRDLESMHFASPRASAFALASSTEVVRSTGGGESRGIFQLPDIDISDKVVESERRVLVQKAVYSV